jgi:hypothetical protein
VGRDRRQEERRAGDRRRRDGDRDRHDRRGGGAWVNETARIEAPVRLDPPGRGRAPRLGLRRRRVRLVYELAAGTLASYLLGDSILQFSTVIGAYLFAMGIGSWLSRCFERQLVAHFLRIELLVGLIGGLMPTALFALQGAATASFRFALYALVLAVGSWSGLEIRS